MPGPESIRWGLAALLSLVLLWAAASDVINRRIPNRSVLAVLLIFVAWALIGGRETATSGLIAAAIAFAAGYLLYAFRVMGAGDVKLFAAVALFAGLGQLSMFALATVLSGGVMAAVSLATRPRRALVMWSLRGRGDYGRGIPYGVAIALGGAFVLWGALFGLLPSFS